MVLYPPQFPFFFFFFKFVAACHDTSVFSAAHRDAATGGSCVCLCGEESKKCLRCVEEDG